MGVRFQNVELDVEELDGMELSTVELGLKSLKSASCVLVFLFHFHDYNPSDFFGRNPHN